MQWSKDILFNKWCWENWKDTCTKKKKELDHQVIPHTRINSKWIKDFNVNCKTIKILENIGSQISDISYSNVFALIPPWARETKGIINKWDYIKLKSFYMAKKTINKIKKKQPT